MPARVATANVIPFPSSSSHALKDTSNTLPPLRSLLSTLSKDAQATAKRRANIKPLPTKYQAKRLPVSYLRDLRKNGPLILAESLDRDAISEYDPDGTSLTPDLLRRGLAGRAPHVESCLWMAIHRTLESVDGPLHLSLTDEITQDAFARLIAELTRYQMDIVPDGIHCTMVDPRFHHDYASMVDQTIFIMKTLQEEHFRDTSKIVVSIPSTKEGIKAAAVLRADYNIRTNLTHVCGDVSHALACLEARPEWLSVCVDPMMEWYERERPETFSSDYSVKDLPRHPAIEQTAAIWAYCNQHKGIGALVAGSNFDGLRQTSPLGMLSIFSLDDYNLSRLKSCDYPITTNLPRSHPAVSLAHSAHAPAYIFQNHKHSLVDQMPSASRSQMVGVQRKVLKELSRFMDEVEDRIREEVQYRIIIKTIELKKLRPWNHASVHQGDSSSKRQERNVTEETRPEEHVADTEPDAGSLTPRDDEAASDYRQVLSSDEEIPDIPDEFDDDSNDYPTSDEMKEILQGLSNRSELQ